MDIGEHNVDAEDLSIAANAFDELVSIVEGILERNEGDLQTAGQREIIARKCVDSIVRRMSGISPVEEGAAE